MKMHLILRRTILPLGLSIFLLSACNNNKETKTTTESDTTKAATDTNHSMNDTAYAPMAGSAQAVLAGTHADTTVTGTARFDTTAGGKVKMILEVTMPAKKGKTIAVHIHEHGDCSDKGEMAHGHWNPGSTAHGKWGSGAFHAGDIGNIKLDAGGKGILTLETDLWTLGGSRTTNIVNRAIILHGGTDDFTTQPTGNAGSRIGCGVIR